MTDPYAELGLPADSDDATIRKRYLELVRQFTPDHHPEKFSRIRAAYESLKDLETRLRYRLFEAGRNEHLDTIVGDVTCRSSRRRATLKELLQASQLT